MGDNVLITAAAATITTKHLVVTKSSVSVAIVLVLATASEEYKIQRLS